MTKKILVLEDEDNIRSFIVINLKRGGYDTVEFSSGEKAVEYMYTHDDVAVAILDVMLPDIDGYEVCRRIREKGIKSKRYGIRLDSGDLAYLSKKAKEMLDAEGFTDAVISASNDLDEFLIQSLKNQGATINSWGVGTSMITSKNCPAFGGVYKLAAIKDKNTGEYIPKIKLSENEEKITNPGNKTIYRIYGKDTHKIIADLICLADETFDENKSLLLFDPVATWKKTMLAPGTYTMRELLVPVFKNGECVYESPSVMEIRAYCQQEKDSLWEETRRLRYPHEVHVDLSDALWNMKHQLLDSISTKIVSEQ